MISITGLRTYNFHITLYDLTFLGTIFIGLTFSLQLWFTKRTNRAANRFLALALATIVLWMAWLLGIDIRLTTYFPHWSWLPLQFSLALGPLIFFYVLKITRPDHKFRWKNLLHFGPLLLQQGVLVLEVKESIKTRAATYDTLIFKHLDPVLQLLAFISVITYLYLAHRLIGRFYRRLKFNWGDRYRHGLRWLHRLLIGFGLLWLLWIPFTAVSYFYYHNQLGIYAYYPLCLLLAVTAIWMAATAFLRPEVGVPVAPAPSLKPPLPAEMKQMGIWLKRAMQTGRYYQDPALSLVSLAEKFELTTHELSRIINTVLKKSFNDFINEYRIADVVQKMQGPGYDHITLLGIAYESGFNSQSTFTRAFKHMTGKTPMEYKNDLKKEYPSYNLGSHSQFARVILHRETTPRWSSEKLDRNFMFKNYFKIAIRQLRKQKMYAAIKIGGFAFSIAACLLIALYIRNELSYDTMYPDAGRIYRPVGVFNDKGKIEKGVSWPAPMGKVLKANFPEIELSGRMMPFSSIGHAGNNELRRAGEVQNTYEKGFTYADQQMLDILKPPMIYGKRETALKEPYTMVISKSKADKYFPGQNPVGQVMYLDDDKAHPYRIGGVMADIPETSHLHPYNFLLTLTGMEFWQGEQNNWDDTNYPGYVLVRPGTNVAQLEKKISTNILKNYYLPTMLKDGTKDAEKLISKFKIVLQPVTDINLYSYDIDDGLSHGDVRFMWLFGAVAGFILIIACINFVNLATAKSANRAKEVGLRKVVGSYRSSLINQFLTESLLYSFLSFAVGLLLAWLLLPYFNALSSKSLTMPWGEWWLLPAILVSAFIIGIIAGLYPAFYLSSFKPAQVLKGALSTGSKGPVLRNSLVVFQFTASIMLIIGTMVIYNQVHYVLNQKVGFDKDQVVIIQGANTLGDKNVKNFKNDLQKLASVKSVSISDYLPIADTKRNGETFFIDGRTRLDAGVSGQYWQIDDNYLKTLGIKLVEGRNFSYDMSDDTAGKTIIINQTMAKKLNLKNPIGAKITNGSTFTVIGVVQDFNFESMHQQIDPLALHFGLSPSLVSVKISGTDIKNTLQSITAAWKQFAPDQPIRYTFMDESFANMYADIQRMGHIFTTFAILAIIIACLGLFALSAFMAEQRSKEIGIRKVLGASVSGITTLLSLDFVKLVALAILIASPIAWWGMNNWLQGFAYHVPVQWWIFASAGLAAILIALITVSFQAIKAALMNPVKSLRSE